MRADAERNAAKVLKAARLLFAEQGTGLHMEQVAQRAGVGVATVYRAYPSKDALFWALAIDRFTEWLDAADRALAAHRSTDDAISDFLGIIARMYAAEPALQALLTGLRVEERPDGYDKLLVRFAALRERGVSDGVLRPGLTVVDLKALICAIGTAISHGMSPDCIVDVLLHGISPARQLEPSSNSPKAARR